MAIRYTQIVFGTLSAVVIAVAGVNLLVDSFSIYGSPRWEGFNASKIGFVEHLRLTHVYRLRALKPNCLLIGTSRTGQGLSPQHPALRSHSCYNVALPAISTYEALRYIQHARALGGLSKIVLGIDFRMFHTEPDISGAFLEDRLAADPSGVAQGTLLRGLLPDIASTLFSSDALLASLRTVRFQAWDDVSLSERGHWTRVGTKHDYAKIFEAYSWNTANRFTQYLVNDTAIMNAAKHFQEILRISHREGWDLILLISPSHAWHWETLASAGLWSQFEELKRLLVRINEDEALTAGREPFPLWDFSGATGPSTEPLPGAAGIPMKWYWDPVHYKSALGDLLLDVALNSEVGRQNAFGVPLRSEGIERHLQLLRDRQEEFRATHSEVSRHLADLVRRAKDSCQEKIC